MILLGSDDITTDFAFVQIDSAVQESRTILFGAWVPFKIRIAKL